MARKIWNTTTKRTLTFVAMIIAGWHLLSTGFTPLSGLQWPSFVTDAFFIDVSVLTLAAGFLLYAVWMMWDNQLNG